MQFYIVIDYITDESPKSKRDYFPIHTLESANQAIARFDPADNPYAVAVDFIPLTDVADGQKTYGHVVQNANSDKFICGRYGKGRANLSIIGKPRSYKHEANAILAIFHFHKIAPAAYNVLAVVKQTAPATLPGLDT